MHYRMRLKGAAFAAILTALGGAAALAQGMPPGGPWHSGWPGFAEAQRAQAMEARGAATRHPEGRTMATRNDGSVPVANNAPGHRRGG
jgi:hypothetical protein